MSITQHPVIHQRDFVAFKGSVSSSERVMYAHCAGLVGAKAPFWYLLTEQPGDIAVHAGEQDRKSWHGPLDLLQKSRVETQARVDKSGDEFEA